MKSALLNNYQAQSAAAAAALNTLYRDSAILLSHLITEDGRIFASQDERFHHYFGRDTMYTALFMAEAFKQTPSWQNKIFSERSKKAVLKFWDFQTKDGKIPHEIKPLTGNEMDSLYLIGFYHKEGDYLINNDSIDATPLTLIATAEYLKDDKKTIELLSPKIIKALLWMITNMDANHGWLTYYPNFNGLVCQGWMDSYWGVTDRDGKVPEGPIALVEVQSYVWKALNIWADLLDFETAETLQLKALASNLRERFHKTFLTEVLSEGGLTKKYFAHAVVDGNIKIDTLSINTGLCLWASYKNQSFIKPEYLDDVVSVLESDKLFHKNAGIRTFSYESPIYDPEYYHNGKHVFWPFATALVAEGIISLGEEYHSKGRTIMLSNLKAITHFQSFIERFMLTDEGAYLMNPAGVTSNCNNQTWTAAAFWWMIHHPVLFEKMHQGIADFDNQEFKFALGENELI